MDVTIAFTVSGQRQGYLFRSLESWLRARRIRDARLLFCAEPEESFPAEDFAGWVSRRFTVAEVAVNESRLGCLANTRQAVGRAFGDGAPFVILAEEDVEVATDVLEYFRWAARTYRDDPLAVAVCAHVMASSGGGSADEVVRGPWFNPIIWGTWEDRWRRFIEPGWGGRPENPQAWDNDLALRIRDAGLCSIFPARSRSLHFGEVSTLGRPEYLYGVTASRCFTSSYPPQDYREVHWSQLPGQLV